MARLFSTMLVSACFLLLAFSSASCKEKRHDTVDAFKSLENFEYAVALYDIDNDGDLDCLNAVRTEFEREPKSATYVLSLKGPNGQNVRNYTYFLRPGHTPDRNVVVIDNDFDHPLNDRYVYSDYENCIIMKFPLEDREACVLWVSSAVKDDVPQTCVDQFQENCSEGTPTYDKDSCGELVH
ncbi:uncharacterized protein LOC144123331 [Amblyomma americanum]